MSDRDRYIPGVPCWVDTTQPDTRPTPPPWLRFPANGAGSLSHAPESGSQYPVRHPGEVSEWLKERDWKSRGRG